MIGGQDQDEKIIEAALSSERSPLRGRVEYHDDRLIKGWALNLASPQRPVSLEVVETDRVIHEFEPTIYRGDLERQGLGAGRFGFVHSVPPEVGTSSAASLHLRFTETGRDLEGSPVQVGAHYEASRVPFETTDLTGNRVLVLSPHPDDEALACGGAVLLHRDANDPVKIVFMTDGSRAARDRLVEVSDYITLRRREARAASEVLGTSDLEFWDYPDRELASAPDAVDRLARLLDKYQPSLVYAPSPLEFHPDHRAAAEILWAALERTHSRSQVAFYDFNRPVNVNTLVDISGVMTRKQEACNAYRSQLAIHPYTEAALSLNRYRALTVSPAVEHAEGYFVTPSSECTGRPVDSFVVRQFLPASGRGLATHPLVSVIIRTKDRPGLLREALSSVLTQSYPNIEVVLINDAGVDVSAIVEEFEPYVPISYRMLKKPIGRIAAANEGLRWARGKYFNFLDDDDVLYPSHINKLVTYLEKTGERLAYSDCERARYLWNGADFQLRDERTPFFCIDFDRTRLYQSNYIPFMTAIFRRDLAEEVGAFDEELEVYEDWDYWIRAAQVTDFVRLPGVTAEYRIFADHDYKPHMAEIRHKHRELISTPAFADATWARISWLESEIEASRLAQKEAHAKAEELEGELEAHRLAEEAHRLAEEAHRLAEEEEVASLRRQLDLSRLQFQMVTDSFSWRLTRIVPAPVRKLLRRGLHKLRPGRGKGEGPNEPANSDEKTTAEPESVAAASSPTRERHLAVAEPHEIGISSYRSGDEKQILELFSTCFGRRRTLEEWSWKYRDNPYGQLQISMAFSPDGELLAHYSAYPCRFIDATSGSARSITALQIGDTMTLPRARNLGSRKTNLLNRVVHHHFAQFSEGRVGFNFGFNTGKIQRYYLKLVPGSQFLEAAPYRVLPESRMASLQESDDSRRGGYRVERVNQVGSNWDDFFKRLLPEYRFLVERDARYVRWRYLECPEHDYRVYAVSLGGRLVGWSVFKRTDDALAWGDALFDPRHPDAAQAVLAHALSEAARVKRVEGWFPKNPHWWHEALEYLGFESRPEPRDLGMIFLAFEEPDPMERFRSHLYYTMGDGDLF